MSDFTVDLKINIEGLKHFGMKALEVGAKGLSQGAELMREHAAARHHQGAHAIGRYENTAGKSAIKKKGRRPAGHGLSKSIKQIPVVIRDNGAFSGIIAIKEYAEPVEKGTSRSKAYPYMVPAMTDPTVQKKIVERMEKVFKRKYG